MYLSSARKRSKTAGAGQGSARQGGALVVDGISRSAKQAADGSNAWDERLNATQAQWPALVFLHAARAHAHGRKARSSSGETSDVTDNQGHRVVPAGRPQTQLRSLFCSAPCAGQVHPHPGESLGRNVQDGIDELGRALSVTTVSALRSNLSSASDSGTDDSLESRAIPRTSNIPRLERAQGSVKHGTVCKTRALPGHRRVQSAPPASACIGVCSESRGNAGHGRHQPRPSTAANRSLDHAVQTKLNRGNSDKKLSVEWQSRQSVPFKKIEKAYTVKQHLPQRGALGGTWTDIYARSNPNTWEHKAPPKPSGSSVTQEEALLELDDGVMDYFSGGNVGDFFRPAPHFLASHQGFHRRSQPRAFRMGSRNPRRTDQPHRRSQDTVMHADAAVVEQPDGKQHDARHLTASPRAVAPGSRAPQPSPRIQAEPESGRGQFEQFDVVIP